MDIFWLRDESLEDYDNLPNPDVFVQEIVALRLAKPRSGRPRARTDGKPVDSSRGQRLEPALEQFREIATDLKRDETDT